MFATDSKTSFERGKRSDSSFVKTEFMNTSAFESFIYLSVSGVETPLSGIEPGLVSAPHHWVAAPSAALLK